MTSVCSLLRWAAYALVAPVKGCGSIAGRLRLPRRMLGARVVPRRYSAVRAIMHSILGGAIGLLTWFVVFLAIVAAVRGVLYPLVAADDLEHSWGGPTLAGAWAVHALLGIGLLPVWLVLLTGLGAVQMRLTRQLLGRNGPWWSIPASVVLIAGGVLFFIAWLHQA